MGRQKPQKCSDWENLVFPLKPRFLGSNLRFLRFWRVKVYIYGFGGITVPHVNGSEAVAFVSMPLKSVRVVADLAFLHNEQILHCQMF